MFNIESWQEIFGAIQKNKLRTFLTSLSVSSGIFILVILLGVGNGMKNGIENAFASDASNNVWVWTGTTSEPYQGLSVGRSIHMNNKDYSLIEHKFKKYIDKKSAVVRLWGKVVSYKSESSSYRIEGIFKDFQYVENNQLSAGRYINDLDVKNFEKVAIIGYKIKQDLFGEENPMGKYIDISGVFFKVVGVYTDPGGEREEDRVLIPFSTAQNTFDRQNRVSLLTFNAKMSSDLNKSLEDSKIFTNQLESFLKKRHRVAPNDNSAIEVDNVMEEAKRFYTLTNMMRLFFWGIGICTIIAGVVGVSNIMFIIVKERTKEIGIRKALGAKPMGIIGMILQESIFITAISGFGGLILGLFLWEAIGPSIQSEFFRNPGVDFWTAVTTVIVLVVAGTLAGFFPARKAAKIKPVEALKSE